MKILKKGSLFGDSLIYFLLKKLSFTLNAQVFLIRFHPVHHFGLL